MIAEQGTRQRDVARRAALAECTPSPSREQSPQWKEQARARIERLRGEIGQCFVDARTHEPNRAVAMALKIHIANDGRVSVAAPDAPYGLPGTEGQAYTGELAFCVVRAVEPAVFPRPDGEAIMLVPLEG